MPGCLNTHSYLGRMFQGFSKSKVAYAIAWAAFLSGNPAGVVQQVISPVYFSGI